MPSPVSSIVPLVAAAFVSGVASYMSEGLPRLPHGVETQLTAYLINPRLLLPGVWFGLVTGALAWRLGRRGVLGALLSLAVTWIGWQLAVQAGIVVFDRIGTITTIENARVALAGAGGGAAGALIAFIGVRASVPMARTMIALLTTMVVGALLGLLLVWSNNRQSAGLLLYATWQPAVVAIMAYFATRKPARPA